MIRKEKRTILDDTKKIFRQCECGNNIEVPQYKEIMVDIIYTCDDRIILEIEDKID